MRFSAENEGKHLTAHGSWRILKADLYKNLINAIEICRKAVKAAPKE